MMSSEVLTATVSLPSGELEPAVEFRIFRAGINRINGREYLFDEVAAQSVMADYHDHGVELAIDLEHESLKESATREDSKDARGYASLELRGGELWATQVKWGPDGIRRIREKTQKFISPAYTANAETGRIETVVNLSLVAAPGTHGALPLAAARARVLSGRFPIHIHETLQKAAANTGQPKSRFLAAFVTAACSGNRELIEGYLQMIELAAAMPKSEKSLSRDPAEIIAEFCESAEIPPPPKSTAETIQATWDQIYSDWLAESDLPADDASEPGADESPASQFASAMLRGKGIRTVKQARQYARQVMGSLQRTSEVTAAPKPLTAYERRECAKRGISEAEFQIKKANAVRVK
jgi:hypothetical protein